MPPKSFAAHAVGLVQACHVTISYTNVAAARHSLARCEGVVRGLGGLAHLQQQQTQVGMATPAALLIFNCL
jgi:hypothetical protein